MNNLAIDHIDVWLQRQLAYERSQARRLQKYEENL